MDTNERIAELEREVAEWRATAQRATALADEAVTGHRALAAAKALRAALERMLGADDKTQYTADVHAGAVLASTAWVEKEK